MTRRTHVRLSWHKSHRAPTAGTRGQQGARDPRQDCGLWSLLYPKDGQGYPCTLTQWVSGGHEVWRSTQDLDRLTPDLQSIHCYCWLTRLTTLNHNPASWDGGQKTFALDEQLDKGAAAMRGKRNYQGKYFQRTGKPFGEDHILEEPMLNVVSLMSCGESPVYNFWLEMRGKEHRNLLKFPLHKTTDAGFLV